MAYEFAGAGALDYFPCRYGQSKLLFRGPRRKLQGRYVAALGGSETYGKFVPDPYPARLEQGLGLAVVNFGCMNAGPDVFLCEPVILEACAKARATVVQVMGAHNISNRFYAVHPRRNDRFLRASPLMRSIFREVDFTEFHFTRHMLSAIRALAPEKYALVEEELKAAWVGRMRQLLQKIAGPTVLLWIAGAGGGEARQDGLGDEPLLVDATMVDSVAHFASRVVRVEPSAAARAAGTEGMVFGELEQPAAAALPGPQIHQEVAEALVPVLGEFV